MGGRSGEEPSNHLWTVYKYTSPKSATESCVCVCLSCYSGAQLTGTTCQRIGPLLSPSGSGAQREWLPGGTEEWVKCHRLELVAARGGDRPAASFHQGWSAMIQQPLSALSTQVPAFRGAVPSSPGAVLGRNVLGHFCLECPLMKVSQAFCANKLPRARRDTFQCKGGLHQAIVDSSCTQTLVQQTLVEPGVLLEEGWVENRCVHGDIYKYPIASLRLPLVIHSMGFFPLEQFRDDTLRPAFAKTAPVQKLWRRCCFRSSLKSPS